MSRCVLLAAMLAVSTPAFAEDIVAYQAEGDAPASGSDARTMALDEAFANAVQSALAELVSPEIRTARKGELDKEIVGRARLWVAKFSVTKDETVEDRRELTVSVRIDRDKLRARLGELNVATKETAVTPPPGDTPLVTAPAKTATVLLRVLTPKGIEATYGDGAIADLPGVGALHNLLRGQGFAVRKAPASGRTDGDLSDDEADVLAAEAKADTFAIATVTVEPPVNVRGKAGMASLVTARMKLVERKDKKVIGEGTGRAAALGDGYAASSGSGARSSAEGDAKSINRAVLFAATDVLPPTPTKLGAAGAFKGEDTPIPDTGVVLVRLPAKTSMSMVLLEQKYLAGAKGVRGATLRRLSPSGWVIGVTTSEPIEQIARIAKKAPATDTSASVKIVDQVVEVTLSGSP